MVKSMKMIQMITLFMVVLGGMHFALMGIGINLFGIIFGWAPIAIVHLVIGVSTLYHVLPILKARLAAA